MDSSKQAQRAVRAEPVWRTYGAPTSVPLSLGHALYIKSPEDGNRANWWNAAYIQYTSEMDNVMHNIGKIRQRCSKIIKNWKLNVNLCGGRI
jgi:hypothetical protein